MKRAKAILIRVSEMEDEKIKALAKRRGKSVAEYLRWLVDRDEATIAP
jgi:predicted DNA-binding protein